MVPLNYQSIGPKLATFDFQTIYLRSTATYSWQLAVNSTPKTLAYYDTSGALIGDANFQIPDIGKEVAKTEIKMLATAAVSMLNTVTINTNVLVKANLMQWGALDNAVNTKFYIDGVGIKPIFNNAVATVEKSSSITRLTLADIMVMYSVDLNWNIAYASFSPADNFPVIFLKLQAICHYK